MPHDIDELTLTAYALGELDAAESAAVEARLAGDDDARRHVADVRATARLVADELAMEPDVGLTALQHAAIEQRLAEGARPARLPAGGRRGRPNWPLWGSLAASVAIVCTVMATVLPQIYRIGQPGTAGTGGPRPGDAGGGDPPPPIIVPPGGSGELPGHADDVPPLPSTGPIDSPPAPALTAEAAGEFPFVGVVDRPLSAIPAGPLTGAVGGSYAAVQLHLAQNHLPPVEAVRTDELLNAFAYNDPAPPPGVALAATVEAAGCPWNAEHRLVRVGVRAADGPTGAATDVRIAVEFNPAVAGAYRLIGYENRPVSSGEVSRTIPADLSRTDGRGTVGPITPGRTLTALYEVVPAGHEPQGFHPSSAPEPLKYQRVTVAPTGGTELLTVTLRYRDPAGTQRRADYPATDAGGSWTAATDDFKFAAGVAAFGLSLRHSDYRGTATLDLAEQLAREGRGTQVQDGPRTAFLDLVIKAKAAAKGNP